MAKQVSLSYTPQDKQLLLHSTKARQILYGGAAGGGKSHSLRWDAIEFAVHNPGFQGYLFRRTLPELQDNHIRQIKFELPKEIGEFNSGRNDFEFRNGSAIHFRYCEKEDDVTRYQGAEMHWVGIDEAAHLTEFQISYLKTRNRIGGWSPDRDRDRLPRFVMASNPGGPGHNYLKSIFLNNAPPGELFHDETMRNPSNPDDKGWVSIFIPARMSDNRYLDAGYEASFGGLPPELARALREGDWDAVVGQALHTLSRERHMLRPFRPPKFWARIMVIDWGTASPFSVGWYAVSDGALLKGRDGYSDRWLPAGSLIRYDEWYGWDGKPNHGLRLSPQEVGRGILRREAERGEVMDYRVGDTEMWAQRGGPGPAEWFEQVDPRLVMRRSLKDRKRNYSEVLARLAGNPRFGDAGEQYDDPMLFITANCTHFWRTVPTLTLDSIDPEKGPETKNQEDHVYDEVAYACRSRPFIITEEDRYYAEFGAEIRRAQGAVADPYAT